MSFIIQDSTLFPAHIRQGDGQIQSVQEHCLETALAASNALTPAGLGSAAYLAGVLHDAGKMTNAFRSYLLKAVNGQPVQRGSVNHTFAGVQYLLRRFHSESDPCAQLTSELLAYAIGSHHGAFDVLDLDGASGFEHRTSCNSNHYDEAIGNFLKGGFSEAELDTRFQAAAAEVAALVQKLQNLSRQEGSRSVKREPLYYYLGMTARLLQSAVIDGDRQSTALFMDPLRQNTALRPEERNNIWQSMLAALERNLKAMPSGNSIQLARHNISELCAQFSDRPCGLYRLNVPTGGGKTLSGLRMALPQAIRFGKTHIFYIAPLISILEQNTEAIRQTAECGPWLLEHHSNVIHDETTDQDELTHAELLSENWDAPVIATTLVQFLNTLFSGKTSCIRRFQALTNSVILLDEVQTVPTHMLSMFNLAMNYLAEIGNSMIFLCSATQPCFEETRYPMRVQTAAPVPYDPRLWATFARTQIQDAGAMRLDEIYPFAAKCLEKAQSLLVVCNKKSEVEELYGQWTREDCAVFHLSASMCVEHRRDVLRRLREALKEANGGGKKVVCVSTQLIEAGVDISFACVIRLCAGMDSIVQSAGRCNRDGEASGTSPVWIVRCENEKLVGLREIQRGKNATTALLYAYADQPEAFQNSLASEEAIRYYYRALYNDIRSDGDDRMDYPVESPRTTLLEMLSANSKGVAQSDHGAYGYTLRQAFRSAGNRFAVFDDDTQGVIVPYGEGKEIIQALLGLDIRWQTEAIRGLLQRAKPYTVSLYDHRIKQLEQQGILMPLCEGSVFALMDGYYSEELGLVTRQLTNCFLEV